MSAEAKVLTGGFTDSKQKDFTAADLRFTTKGNTLYAIALDWPTAPFTINPWIRRAR